MRPSIPTFFILLIIFLFFSRAQSDETDPRKVIVKKLALCVPDRDDMELELTGDLTKLKKQVFTIKEGVQYRIRIDFVVQREIVHGLKYLQKTKRLGFQGSLLWVSSFESFNASNRNLRFFFLDKMAHMVGSYPPKAEIQSYITPFEEAPSGMVARGTYSVTSLFTDDDNNEHLKWDWSFEIKKDWWDIQRAHNTKNKQP